MLSRDPHGVVVYFIESEMTPPSISNLIYNISKEKSPSEAAAAGFFLLNNSRFPASSEEFDQYYQTFPIDPFSKRELSGLDEIAFLNPSRVRLLVERMPDKKFDLLNKLNERIKDVNEALKIAADGNFKDALPKFVTGVTAYGRSCVLREDEIARQLAEVVRDPLVLGLAVGIGAVHSPLRQYQLNGQVHCTFDQKKAGIFVFPPAEILVRRIRLFPEREIPQIIWRQALCGQVLIEAMRTLSVDNPQEFFRMKNDIVSTVIQFVRKNSTSEKEVNRLEQSIGKDLLDVIKTVLQI